MTDGIIQEVNQKIKSMIDWRCKSLTPYDLETWLNLYQEELIEKIKQEYIFAYEFTNDLTMLKTIKIKLIGDSQE